MYDRLRVHIGILLLKTCRDHRNHTMILLCYRHGMRVSELIGLEWNAIDLTTGTIALSRMKHGIPSNHPLTGQELRALRPFSELFSKEI
jgi:integrase